MTRRRFQHCRNEKCNRRLAELLDRPGEPAPAPRWCEACLAARDEGLEDALDQARIEGGRGELRRGFLLGALTSAGVGLVLWAIGRVAEWIAAPPA